MLFHIIAQHDHKTCPRIQNGEIVPFEETPIAANNSWVNGNENVRVVGAWAYPVEHRAFAVVDSNSFEEGAKLFQNHLPLGPVEVLPVRDMVGSRDNT